VLDVARGSALALTSDPSEELFPVWTADGREVVYFAIPASLATPIGDFYRRAANGAGGVEKLSKMVRLGLPSAILSDRSVVYDGLGDGQWQLEMTSNRGDQPIVFAKTGVTPLATVTADGRWVAYSALSESGRVEVYVDSFPSTGRKRQVSTAGGFAPRWRRDGREIFYLAPDKKLTAVPLTIAGDQVEPGVPVPLFDAAIAGGGVPGGGNTLAFRREYDVAPDGQRFLLNLVTSSAMSITVATNWTSRLAGGR
jgi:hypothetical protein